MVIIKLLTSVVHMAVQWLFSGFNYYSAPKLLGNTCILVGLISTSLQSINSEKSVTFDEASLKPPNGYKNGTGQLKLSDSRPSTRYTR